jgi:hypothetical protein
MELAMAEKQKPKHPGGAPQKFFDWELLESLAILDAQCNYVAERMLIKSGMNPYQITQTDIESMHKRINRRLHQRYGLSYVQYVDKKKEHWRLRLRQKQREVALEGNPTILIWLGKQDLGQIDKQESKVTATSEQSRLVIEFAKESDIDG